MAYGFGSGVQAELGTTDYSNYLRGALYGAQMQAQGGAAIGAGAQNALNSISAGVQAGIARRREDKENEAFTAGVQAMLNGGGPPSGGTNQPPVTVPSFAQEAISPSQVLESVYLNNPDLGADTSSPPPAVESVKVDDINLPSLPESLSKYFAYNPTTQGLASRGILEAETEDVTKRMQSEQNAIVGLENKLRETMAPQSSSESVTLPPIGAGMYRSKVSVKNPKKDISVGGQVEELAKLLKFANMEKDELTNKMINLENVRQDAARFPDQINQNIAPEEPAAETINNKSIPLEESVVQQVDELLKNADGIDKNQLSEMKTAIKQVPGNASVEEKVASFINAYSKKAVLDPEAYGKMVEVLKIFPAITNLSNGNQVVTVNGQSFFNNKNEDTVPASTMTFEGRQDYTRALALYANQMPLDQFQEKHPDLYVSLSGDNLMFGPVSALTGTPVPLADMWDMIRGGSGGQGSATPPSGDRDEADFIINQ